MGRAPCCDKVGLKKGRWTKEEDEILSNYIKSNGDGSWRSLPKKAGLLRCGKSCRLRWINYLREDVKRGNISREEEEMIIELHAALGNRWSLIAGYLAGRTDNEIKNYWNSHLSRSISTFRHQNAPSTMTPPLIDLVKVAAASKRRDGRSKMRKEPIMISSLDVKQDNTIAATTTSEGQVASASISTNSREDAGKMEHGQVASASISTNSREDAGKMEHGQVPSAFVTREATEEMEVLGSAEEDEMLRELLSNPWEDEGVMIGVEGGGGEHQSYDSSNKVDGESNVGEGLGVGFGGNWDSEVEGFEKWLDVELEKLGSKVWGASDGGASSSCQWPREAGGGETESLYGDFCAWLLSEDT